MREDAIERMARQAFDLMEQSGEIARIASTVQTTERTTDPGEVPSALERALLRLLAGLQRDGKAKRGRR